MLTNGVDSLTCLGHEFVEEELEIALCVEEEAIIEEAFIVDREASVEMPS